MQVQNSKIKILHVIAPVKFGGGESVLIDLLKMQNQDIEMELLCLCKSIEFERVLNNNKIIYKRIGFTEIKPNSTPFVFFHLLIKLIFSKAIHPLDKKYDIIHCHGFPAVFIGFVQKLFSKKIFIYTHHQQVFSSNKYVVKLFNCIYNKFDTLTFVSNSIHHSFKNKFNIFKHTRIIYNPVSTIFFKNSNQKNNNKILKLIYPARFSSQKAQYELILSFERNKNYNFEIHFYGDGSLRQKCIDLVNSRNLNRVFYFHELIPQNELSLVLENFDLAIFPSFYEGFGVAAAECIASNLPVIYNSDNITLHEVVNEAGWSISINKMGEFILNLDRHEILNKIKNCHNTANKYKIEFIISEYFNLYKQLLEFK